MYVKQLGAFYRFFIQIQLQQFVEGVLDSRASIRTLGGPFFPRDRCMQGSGYPGGLQPLSRPETVRQELAVTSGTGRSLSPQLVKLLK